MLHSLLGMPDSDLLRQLVEKYLTGKITYSARDDGKLQRRNWDESTTAKGVFFNDIQFNILLYNRMMPHKENTNPPVRKIVIGVPEYMGAQIQVEFEMPEPTAVAEACGVVVHKK